MSEKVLKTPIRSEDLLDLRVGDIVYLDGYLITGRDDVHLRVIKQKKEPPVSLEGMAIYHAGPIMREKEDGKYEVVSVGPTTSMRMEKYEKEFLAETGVKLLVGKGGMGEKTIQGCVESKAVHTVFPGGCAVLAATHIEEVERVEWLDLGMPEAMWVLKVNHFGPLIVSIDTEGNSLFDQNKKKFNQIKDEVVPEICEHVDYLH